MTTTPKRIQRKRTKGWKAPEGAVYVGRPTRWGNPAVVGEWHYVDEKPVEKWTPETAVRCYEQYAPDAFTDEELREIRGKDLMCWCSLDAPCHADVLLKLANAEVTA